MSEEIQNIGPMWKGGPDALVRHSPCFGCPMAAPDPAHREHYVFCGWEPKDAALYWKADKIGLRHRTIWQAVEVTTRSCPARDAHERATETPDVPRA